MAAEEDNFDIDIYGDGGEDYEEGIQTEEVAGDQHGAPGSTSAQQYDTQSAAARPQKSEEGSVMLTSDTRRQSHTSKQKEGPDDRPLDAGATSALFVSDLSWWITDDEIRGWASQSNCEDELDDVTFSEHKVNGKSKGQAYILTATPQAATALKHCIESLGDSGRYKQKFTANYTNPTNNPFKTLPKDANSRSNQSNRQGSGNYTPASSSSGSPAFSGGGHRGGRGGYNPRGAMPSQGGYARESGYAREGGYGRESGYGREGGYPREGGYGREGGYPREGGYGRGGGMPMGGGYQGNMGWQGGAPPNTGWQGGFNGRGGMMSPPRGSPMGMRGGRGGMNNMMPMPMAPMPMAPMPMGAMPAMGMGLAMPQMNGMPGGAFQGGAYYPQQGDAGWNPHGAKRTRQE